MKLLWVSSHATDKQFAFTDAADDTTVILAVLKLWITSDNLRMKLWLAAKTVSKLELEGPGGTPNMDASSTVLTAFRFIIGTLMMTEHQWAEEWIFVQCSNVLESANPAKHEIACLFAT